MHESTTMSFSLPDDITEYAVEYVKEQLSRSFSVEEVTYIAKRSQLDVIQKGEVSFEVLRNSIDAYVTVGSKITKNVVYQNDGSKLFDEDPQPLLEAKKEVIPYGEGLFSFQGEFATVMSAIESWMLNKAIGLSALPQDHPSVWPIDLYRKIDYFKEYPHHAMLMTSVKEDYETRLEFAKKYGARKTFDSIKLDQNEFTDIRFGAPNACCDCCYYSLSDSDMQENLLLTTKNKSVRNENSKTGGLDRLRSFTQRDIVAIGTADHVAQYRQVFIDLATELVSLLEISARIETAHDPFFGNDTAMKNIFQYISNVKLEILAKLNFSDRYIAVGSINWHLDFFGKAFNFRAKDAKYANSCCIGIGMERFAYMLYCQFGTDVARWPKHVKEVLSL